MEFESSIPCESGVLWVLSYNDSQYTRWTIRVQSQAGKTYIEREERRSPVLP